MVVRHIRQAALVVAFVSLFPVGQPAWASGQHAAKATTPVQAVTSLVKPFTGSQYNNAACNAVKGKLAACPITARLRAQVARELRYERSHPSGGYGNIFCRCQNPPQSVRISLNVRAASVARVSVRWNYGTTSYSTIFVTVLRQSRWLVDDQYCATNPKSTLYKIPVGPCH